MLVIDSHQLNHMPSPLNCLIGVEGDDGEVLAWHLLNFSGLMEFQNPGAECNPTEDYPAPPKFTPTGL